MQTSTGIIRIEPKSKSTPLRPWWAVIECCPELGRYYLEMSKRAYWFHSGIQRPAWGPHISMMRGEEPPAGKAAWKEMKDREVVFCYDDESIQTDGKHFWINVACDYILDLRETLGLPRQPEFPLHLTFGVADGQAFKDAKRLPGSNRTMGL